MLLDNKLCRYVRPTSTTDIHAQDYEYLLFWIGSNGSPNYWLFEDFLHKINVSGTVINSESENINKIFQKAGQTLKFTAEDINEQDMIIFESLLTAKEIRHYKRGYNNDYEKLAIKSKSSIKRKSDFKYNFEFELVKINKNVY